MNSFKINDKTFVQPELGLQQFQVLIQHLSRMGFKELTEMLNEKGMAKLFAGDGIYWFLAVLFHIENKPDFTAAAVKARKELFLKAVIPIAIVGAAIDVFFSSLNEVVKSSGVPVYFLSQQNKNGAPVSKKKKKKKTTTSGRPSSKSVSSRSPKERSLRIHVSKN